MKFKDEELVLLAAFRYALGKSSYIVSCISVEIIENWRHISKNKKELIKREIVEHMKAHGTFDSYYWEKILRLKI